MELNNVFALREIYLNTQISGSPYPQSHYGNPTGKLPNDFSASIVTSPFINYGLEKGPF